MRDEAMAVALTDPLPETPSLPLVAEGLRFAVRGRRLIEIDRLAIGPGGTTMILGPNGAGKSLLLRLLHGLIAPSAGRVLFGGAAATPQLRLRQAMVFQRPVLLRRTVAGNIDYALKVRGLPRGDRRRRTQELLVAGDLESRARQPARTLSGGEQQRLALMRALAGEPEILFLDEPTSNLDPGATQAIEALLERAAGTGTKVIMVTHDVGQARRLGEEIVFLHHGRVTEQSPAATFFDAPQSAPARAFLAGGLPL